LVCAGVIVHADKKLVAIERHLDTLVDRHIPEHHRENFVFHATEIFNGGGKVFDRTEWPIERRVRIAADLAAIPKKFRLPLAFGWLERAKFPLSMALPPEMTENDKTAFAHSSAFMTCAMIGEHWMRREAPNEVALIVAEDNQRARRWIKEAYAFHQDRRIVDRLSEESRRHFPFRKLKEDPLFQNKRRSSVLQVADFCAYVFKRILMNENDERYLPFWRPMTPYIAAFDDLLERLPARATTY
jgi:hypothetical protein